MDMALLEIPDLLEHLVDIGVEGFLSVPLDSLGSRGGFLCLAGAFPAGFLVGLRTKPKSDPPNPNLTLKNPNPNLTFYYLYKS